MGTSSLSRLRSKPCVWICSIITQPNENHCTTHFQMTMTLRNTFKSKRSIFWYVVPCRYFHSPAGISHQVFLVQFASFNIHETSVTFEQLLHKMYHYLHRQDLKVNCCKMYMCAYYMKPTTCSLFRIPAYNKMSAWDWQRMTWDGTLKLFLSRTKSF